MSEWLYDTLLMTTLLMVLVLIIRAPVARYLGPSVAYWLWLIPAARLFMPAMEKTVAAAPVPDGNSGAAVPMIMDMPIGATANATNLVSDNVASTPIDWTAIALIVWLGGAAMMFILQMIRYSDMREELLSDAEQMGDIDGIKLISSDRVTGPLAFGLFRRYIVVPENFADHFNNDECELALEHELAHHRCGDLYANLFAFIVLCLNWFNPVAWMAWNAFRLDQEAACDARVLAGKDAETRHTYGQTLARAAQEDLPTFATALNSPKTIIERLKRMAMNNDSMKRKWAGRLGIFAAIGIALPLTATIIPVVAKAEAKPDRDGKEDKAVTKKAKVKKKIKIVTVNTDGADKDFEADVEFLTDEDLTVRKIEKDGKKIVIKTNGVIDEKKLERLIEKAEKLAEEATELNETEIEKRAEEIEREAEQIKIDAEAVAEMAEEAAERAAERAEARAQTVAIRFRQQGRDWSKANFRIANAIAIREAVAAIPDIQIREIKGKCKDTRAISHSYTSSNGKNHAVMKLSLCGGEIAQNARKQALYSLQQALKDVEKDNSIPKKVCKDVKKKLKHNIRKLEADIKAHNTIA